MLENKGWIQCLYRKARYNGPIHCKHFFCPKERKNVHEAQSSPNKLDLANIRLRLEKEFLLLNWLKCTFICLFRWLFNCSSSPRLIATIRVTGTIAGRLSYRFRVPVLIPPCASRSCNFLDYRRGPLYFCFNCSLRIVAIFSRVKNKFHGFL